MSDAPTGGSPAPSNTNAAPTNATPTPSTPVAKDTQTSPSNGVKGTQTSPKQGVTPPTKKQGDFDAKPDAKTDAAKADAAAKAEAARQERIRLKLKVDGQEREEEFTPEELTARLQKGEAAERRFQEAAATRKQMQAFLEEAKANPLTALKKIGIENAEDVVEEYIAKKYARQLEIEQLSEPERRALEAEEKLKAFQTEAEQRAEAEKKAKAEAEHKALVEKVRAETHSKFEAALEQLGEHKSFEALAEMARIAKMNLRQRARLKEMDPALAAAYPVLSPEQLAKEVKGAIDGRLSSLEKSVLEGLKGEALLKRLPPSVVKEVIRASVAQFQQPTPAEPPPRQKAPPKEDTASLSTTKKKNRLLLGW